MPDSPNVPSPNVPPPASHSAPHPPSYGAYASHFGVPRAGTHPRPYSGPAPAAIGLGMATIVLAAVWTVVQVVRLATSFDAADRFSVAASTEAGVLGTWTLYDTVGTVMLLANIGCFVVACLWLQRSRQFAEAVAPDAWHTRGRAWVWLGWVVPVVSFWFPFQVVRDIAAATEARPRFGLGWWWLCWLAASFGTAVASWLASGIGDPAMIPAVELVATVVTIVGFVLWTSIVRAIGAAQQVRLAAV